MGTVLVRSLQPPPEAFARSLEAQRRTADVSRLKPGEFLKVTLGESQVPVMFLRRTKAQLEDLERFEAATVDPTSQVLQQPAFAQNRHRSIDPEILVIGLECTHLGCAVDYYPIDDPLISHKGESWRGGFMCPCHNATFDLAGRVHHGMPALVNMVVPPHKFISPTEVLIGRKHDKL